MEQNQELELIKSKIQEIIKLMKPLTVTQCRQVMIGLNELISKQVENTKLANLQYIELGNVQTKGG